MGEPKPLASLSSSLLARKGQAKPAMRPQGFGSLVNPFAGHDDLGWNDMGHDLHHPVPIHQDIHPEPAQDLPPVVVQREELAEELKLLPQDFHAPEILAPIGKAVAQPDFTFEEVEPAHPEPAVEMPSVEPEAPVAAPVARKVPIVAVKRAHKAAKARKGKAAFTLRLDPERHLRLRLACAINRESAQAIVTDALDRFLADLPEIDELARKVPGTR